MSRRGLLLGAGAGAAGLALSGGAASAAQAAPTSSQQVVNVVATIEVLTTVVTLQTEPAQGPGQGMPVRRHTPNPSIVNTATPH